MQMFFSLVKITREYEGFKASKEEGATFGNVKATIIDNPAVTDTGRGKYNANIYLTISETASKYFAELRKGDLVIILGKLAQTKSKARVAGFYSIVPWITVPIKCQNKEHTDSFRDNEVPF